MQLLPRRELRGIARTAFDWATAANNAEVAKWCSRRSWKDPVTGKRIPHSTEQALQSCQDGLISWASLMQAMPYPEVAFAMAPRSSVEFIEESLFVKARVMMIQDQTEVVRSEDAARWLREWSAALMADMDIEQQSRLAHISKRWKRTQNHVTAVLTLPRATPD